MNKRMIKIVIITSVILIVILSIVYAYMASTRNAVETLAGKKKMINILLEGSNMFHDNKHKFYAILSINPDNSKMGITFLPPGLKINLDEKGKNFKRIDEIDIDNFEKISKFLSQYLKLNVPFYIELYAADLERIIDLIEGINIFILDQAVNIPGVKTGLNYFDGSKVIKYINNVENNSIYKKYDRIQDILFTLHNNREKYKMFFNTDFISESLKKINTNLLDKEILSLLKLIYSESDLTSTLLPGTMDAGGYYTVDDISYKIYEKEFLKNLVLSGSGESAIKVKVLNGTNVSGLAKKMRAVLVREGLSVVEFGTSPYPFMDETIIINQKGESSSVKKLSEIIGTDKIYHILDSSQLNNALIIIGKDYIK